MKMTQRVENRHCWVIEVADSRPKVSRICLRNSRLADWKAMIRQTPREVVGESFIPDDNDKGGPHC
jgi:hypothetical protein